MRVIYDISRLGECYDQPSSRSGLVRVIENIAFGLAASPDCEVSFTAQSFSAASDCIDYLKDHSQLSDIPFLSTSSAKRWKKLNKRLRDINSQVDGPAFSDLLSQPKFSSGFLKGLKLQQRAERRLLSFASRAVERSSPIDSRWLDQAEIYHSPFHPLPRQATNIVRFLTIYDLIPIIHPEFCVPSQVDFLQSILHSIGPDDWLFSISEKTKSDLCNYLSIDPARVVVTYLAAAPDIFYPCEDPESIAKVRSEYQIPDGPYILSLNTLEPRKNIGHLIRSFAKLVQEQNLKDLNLVLVGAHGWLYDRIFETISAFDSLRDRIIVTGYVADEHLAALYSHALAFVFPALYEGFGLPPLEAMQCGTPVITSNTSSLPEVIGDAGIGVDPIDEDALCQSMFDVYRDADLRAEMARKSIARAREFSWEKCTREIIGAYRQALDRA